jgi:hypothetical protein
MPVASSSSYSLPPSPVYQGEASFSFFALGTIGKIHQGSYGKKEQDNHHLSFRPLVLALALAAPRMSRSEGVAGGGETREKKPSPPPPFNCIRQVGF